jgi:hypothetical protein
MLHVPLHDSFPGFVQKDMISAFYASPAALLVQKSEQKIVLLNLFADIF